MAKTKLDELFLRVFKGTILVLMTLALLLMCLLLGNALWQGSKRPVEPAPAAKAPERSISIEDLKKELLKESDTPGAGTPKTDPAPGAVPPTLKYLEDVTRLYRCSTDFARKVGAELEETDNAVIARKVEDLRARIEDVASAAPHRGGPWVKSSVEFTCTVLADAAIIGMRKEGKVKSVFFPTLNFHLKAWDDNATAREKFEQAEKDRIERERAAEAARIAQAKAGMLQSLIAAGVLFAAFMALALYLIFAKIEGNLRSMDRSLQDPRPAAA